PFPFLIDVGWIYELGEGSADDVIDRDAEKQDSGVVGFDDLSRRGEHEHGIVRTLEQSLIAASDLFVYGERKVHAVHRPCLRPRRVPSVGTASVIATWGDARGRRRN